MPRKRELVKKAADVAAVVGALPAPDRARLLKLAGYDEGKLVALLQRALSTLDGKLGARRTQRLVVPMGGGVCDVAQFEEDDTDAQLRAAKELLSLIGVYPSKNAGGSGDTEVKVTVVLAPMPAAPRAVEVIEVASKPA